MTLGPVTLAEAIQRSQAALSELDASITQARCCVSRFDQLRAEAATVLGYDATLENDFAARAKLRAGSGMAAAQPPSKALLSVPVAAPPILPSSAGLTGVIIKQQESQHVSTVQRPLLGSIGGLQRQQQHNAWLGTAELLETGSGGAAAPSAERQATSMAEEDAATPVSASVGATQAAPNAQHSAALATEASASRLTGPTGSAKAKLTPWQALQRQSKAAAVGGADFAAAQVPAAGAAAAPSALDCDTSSHFHQPQQWKAQDQQQQQQQGQVQSRAQQLQGQRQHLPEHGQQQELPRQFNQLPPAASDREGCEQMGGSSVSDEELMPLATRRRKLLLEKQQQQRKRARRHEPPQQQVAAGTSCRPQSQQQAQAQLQEQAQQQAQEAQRAQGQQQQQAQQQAQEQQQQHKQEQQEQQPEVVIISDSSSGDERQRPRGRLHPDNNRQRQHEGEPQRPATGSPHIPELASEAGQGGQPASRGTVGGTAAVVKWYAVVKGRRPGLFTSWNDCAGQVLGFKGGEYKVFPTELAACQYLQQRGVHLPPKQQHGSNSGSQGAEPAADRRRSRDGSGSGSGSGGEEGAAGPQHPAPLPRHPTTESQQQQQQQQSTAGPLPTQRPADAVGRRSGGTPVVGQKRRRRGKGGAAPAAPPHRKNAKTYTVDKLEQQAWEAIARAWRQKHMPSQEEIQVLKREQAQAAAAAMGAAVAGQAAPYNMRTPIDRLNAERAAAAAATAAVPGQDGGGAAASVAADAAEDRRARHRNTCQQQMAGVTSFAQVLRVFKVPCEAGRLKDAYRVAVRMYHPDSNSKDKAWRTDDEKIHAEEVMKLINERKPHDM